MASVGKVLEGDDHAARPGQDPSPSVTNSLVPDEQSNVETGDDDEERVPASGLRETRYRAQGGAAMEATASTIAGQASGRVRAGHLRGVS
jgi:hypothetical protein